MTTSRVKTILVHPSPFEYTFHRARAGAEFIVNLHGLRWPVEVRANPPRIRLLEDSRGSGAATLCEIIGDWPGAPAYYPEAWEPGVRAAHNPRPVPEPASTPASAPARAGTGR